jgi:hypothetical protein
MIGVALNLVFSFHTYWQQTNRGHGDDKQFLKLHNTVKTKVFADEESAIKWLLKFLARDFNSVPFGPLKKGALSWKDNVTRFVDRCYTYIVDREWTLEDFVEVLHNHWSDERTRDREEFYNSEIILFDPTVPDDGSDSDEEEEEED